MRVLSIISRTRRRFALLRSESGVALPTAVAVMLIVASLAGTALTASVTASRQTFRDRNVKRALAAADAGVDAAVYRLNKMRPARDQCVVVNSSGQLQLETVPDPAVDGHRWCRTQSEDLGGGASYSYQVREGQSVQVNDQSTVQYKVVSTGLVNGVTRRISTLVGGVVSTQVFGRHAIISDGDFIMTGNSRVDGDVASNSNVNVSGTSALCGNVTYGVGKIFTGPPCGAYTRKEATQAISMPAIDQGNAPTSNDNGRIGTLDPWTNSSRISWNPTARSLRLEGSATLTLTGNVYSLCSLQLQNSAQLIIGARAADAPPVKIYLDSPENCPSVSNAGSMRLEQTSSLLNNNDAAQLQVYAMGSSGTTTKIEFTNSSAVNLPMVIYAPKSELLMQQSITIVGAVAAKTVKMENSSQIIWTDRVRTVALLPLFRPLRWIECAAQQTGGRPDSGC
jgi:type II secretory pathway pseudopilin PulG